MTLGSFIHQKTYEKIEFQIRKHPFTFVPVLFGFAALAAVPFVLYFLFKSIAPGIIIGEFSAPALKLLASAYYLSIGLFMYTYFITFYLDLLVITNDRLLHIEQHNLFARTISELDLYNIQDITSEVRGFFPSIFDYGTLEIQTAGAHEKFIMTKIPNPSTLRQVILDLAAEDRKFHNSALHK